MHRWTYARHSRVHKNSIERPIVQIKINTESNLFETVWKMDFYV